MKSLLAFFFCFILFIKSDDLIASTSAQMSSKKSFMTAPHMSPDIEQVTHKELPIQSNNTKLLFIKPKYLAQQCNHNQQHAPISTTSKIGPQYLATEPTQQTMADKDNSHDDNEIFKTDIWKRFKICSTIFYVLPYKANPKRCCIAGLCCCPCYCLSLTFYELPYACCNSTCAKESLGIKDLNIIVTPPKL